MKKLLYIKFENVGILLILDSAVIINYTVVCVGEKQNLMPRKIKLIKFIINTEN